MNKEPIDISAKLSSFSEKWSPKIVAQMNDYYLKLARIEGEFVWHKHEETDEVFYVLDGQMTIDFRDGSVGLEAGQLFVVPKGVEHKPRAEAECCIMLIEPAGTAKCGDAGDEQSADDGEWI